jgi:putative transcriptional regulator
MGQNMSTFGEHLVRSLEEALAHSRGEGLAVLHPCVVPRRIREKADITQAQMAPLMGMSVSGYREWEQGRRRVSGPVATLLHVMEREPEAVRRALLLS